MSVQHLFTVIMPDQLEGTPVKVDMFQTMSHTIGDLQNTIDLTKLLEGIGDAEPLTDKMDPETDRAVRDYAAFLKGARVRQMFQEGAKGVFSFIEVSPEDGESCYFDRAIVEEYLRDLEDRGELYATLRGAKITGKEFDRMQP